MMKAAIKVCPEPELLGLLFGATIAAAINLLTALVLNGAQGAAHNKVVIGGWVLLAGSCAVGAMAVIVGQKRSEVLDGVGGTVSAAERKALLRQELEKIVVIIGVLSLVWIASIICVMVLLTV
jgi:hypothetical protein